MAGEKHRQKVSEGDDRFYSGDIKASVTYRKNTPYIVTNKSLPGWKEVKRGVFANILNKATRKQVGDKISWFKNFEWPVYPLPDFKPMDHQKHTSEFMMSHRRWWCLNGMRSGKTYSTSCYLKLKFATRMVDRVLIAAPLGILEDTWRKELFWVMPEKKVYVANSSVDEANAALLYGEYDIIIMNHDKIKHCYDALVKYNPQIVIVDEAGGYRYASTDRTKALTALVGVPGNDKFKPAARAREFGILTATPTSQNKTDCWPLARLVSPDRLPAEGRSFNAFREKVCYPVPARGFKGTEWIPRKDCDDYIASCLYPAIKYATADCIELPPISYVDRKVDSTPAQKKAIKELVKSAISFVKDEHDNSQTAIVAEHPGSRYSKVLQVFGGVVKDSDGKPRQIGANKRIAEVLSILEELGGDEKIVLMCRFTGMQKYIQRELKKKKIGSIIINGSNTGRERTQIVEQFRSDKKLRVLIAHPDPIKVGFNLSVANTIVWFLPPDQAEQWIQGNQRATAKKSESKQKILIIKLYGSSVERMCYEKVTAKQVSDESITDIWRAVVDHVKTKGV